MRKRDRHSNPSGWNEGYQLGWQQGYRLGGCKAILEEIPSPSPLKKNLKVLYIPQGFDAIDLGVRYALQELVQESYVVGPQEMLSTASAVKPDLVLVMNGLHVFPPEHCDHMDQIRSMGIKTAIWFADDPYFTDESANTALHYDFVFTHEQNCVSFYQSLGCSKVFYLPLGMTPITFHPRRILPRYFSDVCFIGNAFWNRVSLFDSLAPYLAGKRLVIAGGHWDRLSQYELLQDKIVHGWMPVEETVNYYNGAKIVLNMHRPSDAGSDNKNTRNIKGTSINPRTYEMAGCGTLQITDVRDDLTRFYRPGYDIETFASPEELQQKIEYYLTHEKERAVIAWRGFQTTRKNHLYSSRIKQLLSIAVS